MHYLERRRELHCMLVHGTLCIILYMYRLWGKQRREHSSSTKCTYTSVMCVDLNEFNMYVVYTQNHHT